MVAAVKFAQFVLDIGKGVHNLTSQATGQLKIALTNTAPTAATDQTLSNITQISGTNGYTTGGASITTSSYTGTGTASLVTSDVTFTASGGTMATFRYAVLYNDTPTSPADPLIQYWDYGSGVSLADTETFTVDFGASTLTLA